MLQHSSRTIAAAETQTGPDTLDFERPGRRNLWEKL
jgi:hypothetical protein